MLKKITANNFSAVPYLETSCLMKNHATGIKFSSKKPNVIVGPNGAGKSALMTALSFDTLSYFTGRSSFDEHYTSGSHGSFSLWSQDESRRWMKEFHFLQGFEWSGKRLPALFYRPGMIPGDETSVVHAMMCGYSAEAEDYAAKVEKKSSGQGGQALLAEIRGQLSGARTAPAFAYSNWRYGKEKRDLRALSFCGDYDHQAEALKTRYEDVSSDTVLLLMDEPEQSLDARAEIELWKLIARADCSKVQTVVATHSLVPMMHPDKFNLIEAVPGYIKQALADMETF